MPGHRQTIARIAAEAGAENPDTISGFALKQYLEGLPRPNLAIDPDDLLAQLANELDGAVRHF